MNSKNESESKPPIQERDKHKSQLAALYLEQLLVDLLYRKALKNAELTPDLQQGNKLARVDELLKSVNRSGWAQWMARITIRDSIFLCAYDDLLKSLKGQARRKIEILGLNISIIFFRICQELEIPAELLIPDNLPESLANVFLYIIRLSDEIRSMDSKSDGFLEILQRYKLIAGTFCRIYIDQHFFEEPGDLNIFWRLVDEKLISSGKSCLEKHSVSSLNRLFISPDFVSAGFFKHLSDSENLLRLIIAAILRRFEDATVGWFDTTETVMYANALCDIFLEIRGHSRFDMEIFKANVLFQLLPWSDFTEFLKRLGNPDLCDGNNFCNEYGFIVKTLMEMAKSVQQDTMDGMDAAYSRVLSNHPSRGFVEDRTQIYGFVCSQLSIQ
jgi:hypothetical protein